MRGVERGRNIGQDEKRETIRGSSIDFISASPLLNRQDIFQKQAGIVALYPLLLSFISTIINALITVMPDSNCAA